MTASYINGLGGGSQAEALRLTPDSRKKPKYADTKISNAT